MMASGAMRARYAGTCGLCGERYDVGDWITWDPDDGAAHKGCDFAAAVDPYGLREVCTTCFMQKPCPCDDDQ